VQRNELKSRMEMTDIVNRRRMRHAHMVNINRQIMLEGMRADFNHVDALSRKVMDIVTQADKIVAKNPAGTDLTADMNHDYKWIKTSGIISPDKWGNLPGGEVFTTPGEVNGTYVVDGVVGDRVAPADRARQRRKRPHEVSGEEERAGDVLPPQHREHLLGGVCVAPAVEGQRDDVPSRLQADELARDNRRRQRVDHPSPGRRKPEARLRRAGTGSAAA